MSRPFIMCFTLNHWKLWKYRAKELVNVLTKSNQLVSKRKVFTKLPGKVRLIRRFPVLGDTVLKNIENQILIIYSLTTRSSIMINVRALSQLTTQIGQKPNYSELLQQLKKKYNTNVREQTPREIEDYALNLNERYEQELERNKKHKKNIKLESWGFGQLKIFQWVCLFIQQLKHQQIQNPVKHQQTTKPEIVCKIKNIFVRKPLEFIRYQYVAFLKSKSCAKKQWKQEEEQLLFHIIDQDSGLKNNKLKTSHWKYYSFLLFTRSKGKFYKTQKQCREKWANYLNPKVKRDSWLVQEDIKLLEFIKEHGFKWSLISLHFNHQRTEHMVKNRYHSMVKSWKRQHRKQALNPQQVNKMLSALYQQLKKQQKSLQQEIYKPQGKEEMIYEVEEERQLSQQVEENEQNKNSQVVEFINEYEYQENSLQLLESNKWKQPVLQNLSIGFLTQNEKNLQTRTRDDDQDQDLYSEKEQQYQLNIGQDIQQNFEEFDPFVFEPWAARNSLAEKEEKKKISLLKEVTDFLDRDYRQEIGYEEEFLKELEEKAQLQWLQ